jgi:hypothetical protein
VLCLGAKSEWTDGPFLLLGSSKVMTLKIALASATGKEKSLSVNLDASKGPPELLCHHIHIQCIFVVPFSVPENSSTIPGCC